MIPPTLSFCTHCHRRLYQLREVFEANLEAIEAAGQEWCLLDYCSDDGMDEFVQRVLAKRRWPSAFRYARLVGKVPYDMIRGKNLSASLARAPVLFNLDADNRITSDEIARLIAAFSDPAVVAVHNYSGTPKDGSFGRVAIRSRLFFHLNGYTEDLAGAAYHDKELLTRAADLGAVLHLPMKSPPAIPNGKAATIANLPRRLARDGYAALRETNQRVAARPQRLVPPIAPALVELVSGHETNPETQQSRIMLRPPASAVGPFVGVSDFLLKVGGEGLAVAGVSVGCD